VAQANSSELNVGAPTFRILGDNSRQAQIQRACQNYVEKQDAGALFEMFTADLAWIGAIPILGLGAGPHTLQTIKHGSNLELRLFECGGALDLKCEFVSEDSILVDAKYWARRPSWRREARMFPLHRIVAFKIRNLRIVRAWHCVQTTQLWQHVAAIDSEESARGWQGASFHGEPEIPWQLGLNYIARAEQISPRLHSIIPLAGAGLSDKEIAAQLQISVMTVQSAMQVLRKKIGVVNRACLPRSLHGLRI
jgi:DNA-binding CsgD family transcriptional regulator